jgi:hypothetical protein
MIRACLIAAVLSIVIAPAASAATKNGITPLSPKAGATIPVGQRPTFKLRVSGPGHVWVSVCKSQAKDKDGVICSTETLGEAKKKGGVYSLKAKFFDFPAFWLNSPGAYYWQAYRIDCSGSDCKKEGPIVKFKVG